MSKHYWLVKQEPDSYAWETFVKDGKTVWDGVRNYAARNHLRAMKAGDEAFFYASGDAKCVMGVARITREAFPDPSASAGEDWVAVELSPVGPMPAPVTLAAVKADKSLAEMALVRISRLSVQPVSATEWRRVCELGGWKR